MSHLSWNSYCVPKGCLTPTLLHLQTQTLPIWYMHSFRQLRGNSTRYSISRFWLMVTTFLCYLPDKQHMGRVVSKLLSILACPKFANESWVLTSVFLISFPLPNESFQGRDTEKSILKGQAQNPPIREQGLPVFIHVPVFVDANSYPNK